MFFLNDDEDVAARRRSAASSRAAAAHLPVDNRKSVSSATSMPTQSHVHTRQQQRTTSVLNVVNARRRRGRCRRALQTTRAARPAGPARPRGLDPLDARSLAGRTISSCYSSLSTPLPSLLTGWAVAVAGPNFGRRRLFQTSHGLSASLPSSVTSHDHTRLAELRSEHLLCVGLSVCHAAGGLSGGQSDTFTDD